ncbi:MAG: MBL fold metallo-hydrolase, partial [Paludibacteraceae bacterium]|nr:MBL fold metallo-hydrolase [Paludibacteraceae bacterium]
MEQIHFLSFGSGSSGNCYFVGNAEYGFFIDAGISPRKVKAELKKYQIQLKNILGLFVTHSHYDHTKYVSSWGEKYGIPIFTTEKIHLGIDSNPMIARKLSASKKHIAHSEKNIIKDFEIECFHVPHDTHDCVGYSFQLKKKRLTIITDLGTVCDVAKEHIRKANYLILEANYDEM